MCLYVHFLTFISQTCRLSSWEGKKRQIVVGGGVGGRAFYRHFCDVSYESITFSTLPVK